MKQFFIFSQKWKSEALLVFCLFFSFVTVSQAHEATSAITLKEKRCSAYGDAIIQGLGAEPMTLLPFMSPDASSSAVASHFYISLLKYDKNIKVIPYAAESFDILDEGLRFRFTLRKGISWQDGKEVTVDDVEFTYRLMIDENTPTAYGGDFRAISEFIKVDTYTFEVRYSKPFARAVSTWMQPILPKHALEGQNLRTTSLARSPLSSGPFTLTSWKPGSTLTLRAHTNFFEGRPCLDAIVYRVIPDMSTLFLELRAEKIDTMENLTPLQYCYQTQDAKFRSHFTVYKYLGFVYTYLGYNLKSPLFSDVRVRKAFAYAINKKDIIKGALMGQGLPTVGPFRPGVWVYNTSLKDYPYDLEKAQQLLAEAGWTKNEKGLLLNREGKEFVFTILINQGNEPRMQTALIIQSQLKKLGVKANIRMVEWSAFISQFISKGFFDATVLGWTTPQEPDPYDVWHSSGVGGRLNFIGYANPEADRLLERARETFDQALRKDLYDRFQEILHEEQPYCFLYVPYTLAPVQRRFQGIELAPAGIGYNFNDWWVPLQDQLHRMTAQ